MIENAMMAAFMLQQVFVGTLYILGMVALVKYIFFTDRRDWS